MARRAAPKRPKAAAKRSARAKTPVAKGRARTARASRKGAKTPAAADRRRPSNTAAMLELATGYWLSQLVYVAAKLGIADALAKGPLQVDELARRVGAQAPHLRRVLRALASRGVFAESGDGKFRLTPLGATLRSDQPGSLHAFTLMIVEAYNWNAWRDLLHGVRTGERAFDHVHGKPLFDWLRDHPDDDRIFSASMASISGVENAAIARAYDYGKLGTLVDVGGAHGHLLAAILKKHRGLRGILFDQPQVVAAAATDGAFLGASDVAARCEFRGGSFFDGVPEGADAYLMKYIIHDWDDELCTRILRHCREAMAPGGRVLVVDHVVKPGNGQDWAKLLDINMMVLPGGKERSKPEFEKLLAGAGLRLRRVIPTDCPLSIMEATAD